MIYRAKKFARKSALRVLDFALSGNEENCRHLVDILGLKTLFAAFMKKGHKKNKRGFDELQDDGKRNGFVYVDAQPNSNVRNSFIDSLYSINILFGCMYYSEHIGSCIGSLFKHLPKGGPHYNRLVAKFKENNFQKIERLIELHMKYVQRVDSYDAQVLA